MTTPTIAPYGTWTSPLDAATVASGSVRFGDVQFNGDSLVWLESRPLEGGRSALMQQAADGTISEIMPDGWNARTLVHGYGGAPYIVRGDGWDVQTESRYSWGAAAFGPSVLGAAAVGANCGHAPEDVLEILPQIRQAAPGVFLIAKPNAGIPRLVKRQVVYDAGPDRMAELARQYVALGASVVGACCGSSPEHIAAMRQALAAG